MSSHDGEEKSSSGYGGSTKDHDEAPCRGEAASYYNPQSAPGKIHLVLVAAYMPLYLGQGDHLRIWQVCCNMEKTLNCTIRLHKACRRGFKHQVNPPSEEGGRQQRQLQGAR